MPTISLPLSNACFWSVIIAYGLPLSTSDRLLVDVFRSMPPGGDSCLPGVGGRLRVGGGGGGWFTREGGGGGAAVRGGGGGGGKRSNT